MKCNRRIPASILMMALFIAACSKSNPTPAAATGGCTVSFKGSSIKLATAICVSVLGVEGLTAIEGGTSNVGLVIARDASYPSGSSVTFTDSSNDTYSASEGVTSIPTITVSGKSWTFSGSAMNGAGDTQSISGTCTCTN